MDGIADFYLKASFASKRKRNKQEIKQNQRKPQTKAQTQT